MNNSLDIRSFVPSNSDKPILNRFCGKYGDKHFIIQTFSALSGFFEKDQLEQIIIQCKSARNKHKSLACISGYLVTPMFSMVAWHFSDHSQTLAQKLPKLNNTQRVNISIGLIRGLRQLHSQHIVHGSFTPYSIILKA